MGCGVHFIPSLVGPTKSRRLREARGEGFFRVFLGGEEEDSWHIGVALKGVRKIIPCVLAYKLHVVDGIPFHSIIQTHRNVLWD